MWTSGIEKKKSKSEKERLEQAEDNIWRLKEIVEMLVERIEELEKESNDK